MPEKEIKMYLTPRIRPIRNIVQYLRVLVQSWIQETQHTLAGRDTLFVDAIYLQVVRLWSSYMSQQLTIAANMGVDMLVPPLKVKFPAV